LLLLLLYQKIAAVIDQVIYAPLFIE